MQFTGEEKKRDGLTCLINGLIVTLTIKWPKRISMFQAFYLSLSKSPVRLQKYLMCFTKKGENRAKSGMMVLKRVFALRRFRQSALRVQRIAAHINNSGDVERQGLHIVLHRSHADRKAQRVLRKRNTNCFMGNVC